MPLWVDVPLWLAGSVALWATGAVAFDAVHYLLHVMLRSRSRLVRALAWPHAVHHRWLDDTLTIRWEHQTANVFCHLVPEYLTQLAFTLIAALVVPTPVAMGCAALQTAIFVGLLSYRGLDVNHRGVTFLDAHKPSPFALPAYHALHHVHPDAYFSAYGKLVDWLVAGGTHLHGRRVALAGPLDTFGHALRAVLEATGARVVVPAETSADLDVLVLLDPMTSVDAPIEGFIAATRTHLVPPEVWTVRTGPHDRLARHYQDDVRVVHRTVLVPSTVFSDDVAAARAARTIVRRIRRGAFVVALGTVRERRRSVATFRRTRPVRPLGIVPVPSRAAAAGT
jgi:hypothetical protein